jgi:hypothetical protein
MENEGNNRSREELLIAKVPMGAPFEHYKGKKYQILGVGRHSETLGICVLYQALYDCPTFGDQAVWVRPIEIFLETIVIDGKEMPRFRLIEGDFH